MRYLLLSLLLLLSGCGQKGPLRLPEPPPQPNTVPATDTSQQEG